MQRTQAPSAPMADGADFTARSVLGIVASMSMRTRTTTTVTKKTTLRGGLFVMRAV